MGPPNGIHGTNETLAPTIRSVLADVVKKVVEEETRQGCSSVVARMLSNADKAWAEYCHRAGIDRDTPLGSPFLPDDGSGEEYERAAWRCAPKSRPIVCQHGRCYLLLQQSKMAEATQPALATWSHPYARITLAGTTTQVQRGPTPGTNDARFAISRLRR